MKRICFKLSVLLMVLLFITSCGVNIKNSPNVSANNNQSTDKNAFYINGNLPDIGEFSGIQERFYEDYTPVFIPSDQYAEILPFIGKSKLYVSPEEDFYASQLYYSYGFCTKDGKIIMDANEKMENVMYAETSDGFGYYTAREIEDENPEDYDIFEINKTSIIPKSGKWCLELSGNSWLSAAGGGIFCITEYPAESGVNTSDSVKTHIYDYEKNLLLTLYGVEAGVLSNGLILTTKWNLSGAEYNFIDIEGNKKLGPYSIAMDFNEYGYTYVANEGGNMFIIDTTGKRITNTPYSNIYYESGTYDPYSKESTSCVFLATRADNSKIRDIYSADGKFLGTAEGGSYISLRFPKNGDIYYGYSNYDLATYTQYEQIWKKLSNGELFTSIETGKCPIEYSGTDDYYVSNLDDNETTVIFDCEGKTVCKILDFNSFVRISPDKKYLVYTSGKNESYYDELLQQYIYRDNTKLNIFDLSQNKILHTFDANGHAEFSRDSRYALVYLYNEVNYFSGDTVFLYDAQKDEILFENATEITKLDISGKDYFNVCTPSSNTLYDSNLNAIIKTYNE